MKFSELKGRAVIDLADAVKIGEVEDLIVEPDSHHIVSLKVKTGLFQASRLVPVAHVKNVGADAITISVDAGPATIPADTTIPPVSDSTGQPTAEQQSTSKGSSDNSQTAPVIEVTSILGNKVVTDAGTMVGELRDVMVDWVDLTITGYEVHDGGMFSKAQDFADTPDVHYGNKLITIPAQLLSHPN
jgi:sporulation protein YlmC with PRC-barrel domain